MSLPEPNQPLRPPRAKSQKSLAKTTRDIVGDDGEALIRLWWSIANDELQKTSDRIAALNQLADRGWGKAAGFVPQEGDPLGLENIERAAERFRSRIVKLADSRRVQDADRPGSPGRVHD